MRKIFLPFIFLALQLCGCYSTYELNIKHIHPDEEIKEIVLTNKDTVVFDNEGGKILLSKDIFYTNNLTDTPSVANYPIINENKIRLLSFNLEEELNNLDSYIKPVESLNRSKIFIVGKSEKDNEIKTFTDEDILSAKVERLNIQTTMSLFAIPAYAGYAVLLGYVLVASVALLFSGM